MSIYRVQGESLTAIADEIRTLSGTTDTMGPDAMASNVGDANDEVASQADLLAQIVTALEGKSAGSGSGGVETCTVTLSTNGLSSTSNSQDVGAALIWNTVENDEIILKSSWIHMPSVLSQVHPTITCVKESHIILGYITTGTKTNYATVTGGVECVDNAQSGFTCGFTFKVTDDGSITM